MTEETTEQMIPKKIFQTWHTKDFPPKMNETIEDLKRKTSVVIDMRESADGITPAVFEILGLKIDVNTAVMLIEAEFDFLLQQQA